MFGKDDTVRPYLRMVADVASRVDVSEIQALREAVRARYLADDWIYAVGNGGGATIMEHFVLGMTMNVQRETGLGGRALCLGSSPAFLSAGVNDFGDRMFAAHLESLVRSDHEASELLVAFSASGTSKNVLEVVRAARRLGMDVVAMVGTGWTLPESPIAAEATSVVMIPTDVNAVAEDVAIQILHWVYCSFMQK